MKARLTLKVHAGARKSEFAGPYGDGWTLRVAAPPVDGKANQAIVQFLAGVAGVRTSAVRIVSGAAARTKIVEIEGVARASLDRAILESDGHSPHSGSAAPRKA
ncbi:MAG TPA: DUF167 domain-containing protein [Bryobacteraceae bacterium]|nr:DUF167 domain-containing protein [Bryobacteraceae bacterium]